MDTIGRNTIFTNCAKTDEGDIWWEGMTGETPDHLIDWKGEDWTPDSETPAAHPNARFTAPASQCPVISDKWDNPQGVPISAILFGGRRANTVPLVTEAKDWDHGVFLGSIMSSEKTAAAAGTVGEVRFDPFAMLPFCGYNVGEYFGHWLGIGDHSVHAPKLPRLYWVNWFQKDDEGHFMWPGFGDNSRVVKWIIDRLDGNVDAVDTAIGRVPKAEDLDVSGLDLDQATVERLVTVDTDLWRDEVARIEDHYAFVGERLPAELRDQLRDLEKHLDDA
jgi:phosphoenolpyruvate carboxykinase (GTP)